MVLVSSFDHFPVLLSPTHSQMCPDEMRAACLEAGGLPVCEKARVRFPEDPKVQQHSVYAINTMLQDDIDETSIQTRKECTVQ